MKKCFALRFQVDVADRSVIFWGMETIMFKAPVGTKAKLRAINPNVSALLREQTEKLLSGRSEFRSAHDRAKHLCGVINGGPADAATSREYLKQYAPKSAH
jgi:hypothetical protein